MRGILVTPVSSTDFCFHQQATESQMTATPNQAAPCLLVRDIQSDDPTVAYEAAKTLPDSRPRPVKQLLAIMFTGTSAHSREAAAYALSWMSSPRHDKIYPALLTIAGDRRQPETLRGQAFEGIAYHRLSRRHHLWPQSLRVIRAGLADASGHVVFWACFAAGTLFARELLPPLKRLRDTDRRIERNWWSIADEASDAISAIQGLSSPFRTPRSNTSEL
jgi:hypothetical protein